MALTETIRNYWVRLTRFTRRITMGWKTAVPDRKMTAARPPITALRLRSANRKDEPVMELFIPGDLMKKVGFQGRDLITIEISDDHASGRIRRVYAGEQSGRHIRATYRGNKAKGIVTNGKIEWPDTGGAYRDFLQGQDSVFPSDVRVQDGTILFSVRR